MERTRAKSDLLFPLDEYSVLDVIFFYTPHYESQPSLEAIDIYVCVCMWISCSVSYSWVEGKVTLVQSTSGKG